jgi:two-component system, OmpR family, KDP operon response regulator KdpE
MTRAPRVLVIDEDPAVRRLLRRMLGLAGYRVQDMGPSEAALVGLAEHPFDLAIVDLDAVAWCGVEAIRFVRGFSPMPILALSARTDEDTSVEALESGADDCVCKPFNTKVLLARVANAMRRRAREEGKASRFVTGDLEIDLLHRRIRSRGQEVRVSAKPYEVLRLLAEAAGKVVAHHEILRAVWGPDRVNRIAYLRIAIRELRRKLEPTPDRPCYILTEARVGYRLDMPRTTRRRGLQHDPPTPVLLHDR